MKKLSDDEILDLTYNKLFGDLDHIRSGAMFSDEEEATEGKAPNAAGLEGVSITVKPLMVAAQESGKPKEEGDEDEEEEDKLKGIGGMSPLMSQLHGGR